jgi:hypothetical protein
MKFKTTITLLAITLCSAMSLAANPQEEEISSHPGYLDLESILQHRETHIKSEVYLQNYILRMISRVAQKTEPEFAKMLSAIKLIRVLEFDFTSDGPEASQLEASKLFDYLGSNRWDTLVRSREGGNQVQICIQTDRSDKIYALAIISAQDHGMTVVNVVGDIDLDMLSRLGSQFNIPALAEYEEGDSK